MTPTRTPATATASTPFNPNPTVAEPPTHDTTMQDADPSTTITTSATTNPPPRKHKKKESPHILHTSTFRKPLWTYFHLHLTTPSLIPLPAAKTPSPASAAEIDPLTASTLLTPALSAYLGLHGAAIPIDILLTTASAVYVRVPRQDARGVRAALASWVGTCDAEMVPGCSGKGDKWGRVRVAWRVVGEGEGIGVLGSGDGMELFDG